MLGPIVWVVGAALAAAQTRFLFGNQQDAAQGPAEDEKLAIESEVQGSPLFTTDEFELGREKLSVKALGLAINSGFSSIDFGTRETTRESLNYRLSKTDFYDAFLGSAIDPLLCCFLLSPNSWVKTQLINVIFPSEIKELVRETEDYRGKPFAGLSLAQQLKILRLNRLLLEHLYPQLCPKSALKGRSSGYMAVAFASSRRFYLLLDGKIVAGQKVKKSDLNGERFGFLAGSAADEIQIDFPIPFAGSPYPGPRRAQYDKKMPWGRYYFCDKSATKYGGKGLLISYPNLDDARRARVDGNDYGAIQSALKAGRCPPKDTAAGGYLLAHALSGEQLTEEAGGREAQAEYFKKDNPYVNVVTSKNWTWGCLAFEFSALDYLLRTVPVGTPLVLHGFAGDFFEN